MAAALIESRESDGAAASAAASATASGPSSLKGIEADAIAAATATTAASAEIEIERALEAALRIKPDYAGARFVRGNWLKEHGGEARRAVEGSSAGLERRWMPSPR